MPVTGLDAVKINETKQYTTKNSTLGKNEFLNLFVTQLKNQDPLDPMDSSEFTAQLAQFSSLEQLNDINDGIKFLKNSQTIANNRQALGFIGKTVTASGNSINVSSDDSNTLHFNLSSDADDVFINIYDDYGNLIRHSEYNSMTKGEHSVNWDGNNDMGEKVQNGKYTFEVLATDEKNGMVNTDTYLIGEVTGVDFKDGTSYLLTKDDKIFVGDVKKVIDIKEKD